MGTSSLGKINARGTITALSMLMSTIGVLTILGFISSILQDEAIQLVLNWTPSAEVPNQPSLILIYLERFGIIMTGLILFVGIFFMGIGWKIRKGHIRTANWASMTLMWLAIGMLAFMMLTTFNAAQDAQVNEYPLNYGALFTTLLPPALLMLIAGSGRFWINRNLESMFIGEDTLLGRETRLAWNLLIPTLVIFIIVAARPLEQTFVRSLTDKRFAGGTQVPQFVGLDNYTKLLTFRVDTVSCKKSVDDGPCDTRDNGAIRWESIDRDLLKDGYRTVSNISISDGQSLAISGTDDDFLEAIGTTITFTVYSVALELAIGLFMAMVVNSKFFGRGAMRAVMLVPWAIPTVISARLWELMLKDTSAGIFNKILLDLNLIAAPQAWLSDPTLQLPTAIIVDVWKTAPFMALILLAGLQVIPKDLYEAASVDGASPVRRFFSITLPLLRPAIAIALIFRTLDALRVFDLFNVLFGRQQLSMATYNFETLVSNQLDGYASTISVIIFIFISIFAFAYVRVLNVETD
jgi:trehalose/maltose transport system permease protein